MAAQKSYCRLTGTKRCKKGGRNRFWTAEEEPPHPQEPAQPIPGVRVVKFTTENKYETAWITVIHVKVLPHYPGARQMPNPLRPISFSTLGP